MKVNLQSITYQFGDNNETTSIMIQFQGNQGSEYLTSQVSLTGDGLDDLTRKEIEAKARQRLLEITTPAADEEEPAK
ncbi:hypothetical protein [Companilactobacillus nodensis]|uniref:Uncharacterized protein n=1 Tax=Companilactobacillus nodensis DSM 19682 = JCM 14932 = NBRC 107160 TaxID=1423775 RepID=A0A0R1KJT1_9LACO|nr:hypothetical protein [Companilactobacillus nodensis]KRK80234.1 hypothetical protein FD03_GL002624 [Companilactobacillus nodensis DSM 19682 = JCM 14932 = NBRC 107160]